MIYVTETFPTREDAEAFKARLYRSYHPMGYGTHVDVKEAPDPNDAAKTVWVAKGSYASTCD